MADPDTLAGERLAVADRAAHRARAGGPRHSCPRRVFASGQVFGRGKKPLEGIDDLAIDAAAVTVDYTGGHVLSACVNWGMPEGFPDVTSEQINGPAMIARPAGAQALPETPPRPGDWRSDRGGFTASDGGRKEPGSGCVCGGFHPTLFASSPLAR